MIAGSWIDVSAASTSSRIAVYGTDSFPGKCMPVAGLLPVSPNENILAVSCDGTGAGGGPGDRATHAGTLRGWPSGCPRGYGEGTGLSARPACPPSDASFAERLAWAGAPYLPQRSE